MRKSIAWAVVYMMIAVGLIACTESLESRITKGQKKYQELTLAQKENCNRLVGIGNLIFVNKSMGHNLAETKTAVQSGKLLGDVEIPQDMKLSAGKLTDLIYAKEFSANDATILGQVVCTEDMK